MKKNQDEDIQMDQQPKADEKASQISKKSIGSKKEKQ